MRERRQTKRHLRDVLRKLQKIPAVRRARVADELPATETEDFLQLAAPSA